MFDDANLSSLSMLAAPLVALLAGLVSFLSPCIAPLVPGYLAFVASDGSEERRVVGRTLSFVAGFTIVFVLLGLGAATVSRVLVERRAPLELGAGGLVSLLGLSVAWGRPLSTSTGRIAGRLRRPGSHVGAALVGAALSLAWTPCIGPVLAAILALAGTGQDPARGAVLLGAYAAGLGLPFVVASLGVQRFVARSRAVRRHTRRIQVAAGMAMVAMGVFIASGQMSVVSALLARWATPLA